MFRINRSLISRMIRGSCSNILIQNELVQTDTNLCKPIEKPFDAHNQRITGSIPVEPTIEYQPVRDFSDWFVFLLEEKLYKQSVI